MKYPVVRNFGRVVASSVAVLVLFVSGLMAQETQATAATPTADASVSVRGVRLSEVTGSVKLLQANQLLTDAAVANMTLYEGTQIAAGADGRAEIQLEDGSLLRLTPNSTLTLNVLSQQESATDTEIELNGGLAYFELQPETDDHKLEVKFGNSVVTASSFSVMRINLDKPPGSLAVFSGDAHLERPGVEVDVEGGESLELSAADPSQYNLTQQIAPDSWDAWNADRDHDLKGQAAERTPATNDVPNSNNPAWSDLDANGSWYDVPGEGQVWSPTEAASSGWDPYGDGFWVSTPLFGYGWVSAEPWGYLPYRCGRWNYYNDFGWGWQIGEGVCNPWFGRGGWVANIGYGPAGYRLPHRPRVLAGNGRVGAIVAVNHNQSGGNLIRSGNGSVAIGGHAVEAMRPMAPRPMYRPNGSSRSSVGSRSSYASPSGNSSGGRGGYATPTGNSGARPGYSSPAGNVRPAETNRPSGNFSPRSSGGGSRPLGGGSAPVSHFSGGGGGGTHFSGGGGHVSGGGAGRR